MNDQIGRHDASGPLARGADGRTDPDGYVVNALQGRQLLLVHGLFVSIWGLLLLIRGFGSPGAFIALGILVAIDLLIVTAIRRSQWWAERRRRRTGQPPSWSAQIFVLQARTQGVDIPKAIRDDSRLVGRLVDYGDHWEWVPGKYGRSKAVQPITLAPGWTPRLTRRVGSHSIATFDTATRNGPRFDFIVGQRRSLARHLEATPESQRRASS